MSLIGSLLSLAIIPLKAKVKERPKEIDNLAVMALAEEVRLLQLAFDYWRNAAMALMDENERLREERGPARLRLRQAVAGQQAQQNATMAQQLQQSYQGLGQLQQSAYDYYQGQHACTCVPSRADAFRNDNSQ